MRKSGISRRRFLKSTVAATAGMISFPYIIPSSALGKAGTVAPSNRLVMGNIGLGGQGTRVNLLSFLSEPDVHVAAVCDVDTGHRQRALNFVNRKYGNKDCAAYNDSRELLGRDDIDIVVICTPDHWHGAISVAAAKAGKDIYCEKPLANTIAEGRAVCNAVKRYGRILQTGSHERSNDSVRFACELIRNGRIGQLQTIRVNMPLEPHVHAIEPQPVMPVPDGLDWDMWLGPAPWAPYTDRRCHAYWRYVMDTGAGEITDRGAHILDLAQLGNAMDDSGPVEIIGRGQLPNDGPWDTFMKFKFMCRYANRVLLIGQSDGERGLKFGGSEGWIFIHIHGGRLDAEPKSLLQDFIKPGEIHLGRSPGHQRNFIDSVKLRRQPIAHAEIGHRTATVCHLINIAMLTENRLQWDPVKEQIVNDEEANRMLSRPMRSPWCV